MEHNKVLYVGELSLNSESIYYYENTLAYSALIVSNIDSWLMGLF
jgi:hypothetical protein